MSCKLLSIFFGSKLLSETFFCPESSIIMKRPIERKKTVDQSSKFSPKSLEDWSITLNPNFSFFEMEYFIIKNLHSTKNIFMGKHRLPTIKETKKGI